MRIIAVDRDQENLAASCQETATSTGSVNAVIDFYVCDLSQEAEVDGLVGQAPEEGVQAVAVLGADRPEVQRGAVSEHDVGLPLHGIDH